MTAGAKGVKMALVPVFSGIISKGRFYRAHTIYINKCANTRVNRCEPWSGQTSQTKPLTWCLISWGVIWQWKCSKQKPNVGQSLKGRQLLSSWDTSIVQRVRPAAGANRFDYSSPTLVYVEICHSWWLVYYDDCRFLNMTWFVCCQISCIFGFFREKDTWPVIK